MNPTIDVTVLTTCDVRALHGLYTIHRRWAHLLFVNALHSSGQTVHTGGKPGVVFQDRDARQRPSRADVPHVVRPEEEKGVGPALRVSNIYIFDIQQLQRFL